MQTTTESKKDDLSRRGSVSGDALPYILTALGAIILLVLALLSNGTGDDGDGLVHFIYSQSAFKYPDFFFHQWAKPLFVMFTAPLSQVGIIGMKITNIVFWVIGVISVIKIAAHFNIANRFVIPILALSSPFYLAMTLSGYTETMFGTWFAVSVLLLLRGKYIPAYLMFSFLPFVRSEGLILLCPLIIYMIWRSHWRYLLWLPVGHLVYMLLGYPVHQNVWWVFNTLPYATLTSGYGSGPWNTFILQMHTIIGFAQYGLLVIGLLDGLVRLIFRGKWIRDEAARDEAWLIYAMFLSYFIAHSIFWWQGLFNSYGLVRVMIGIMPAMMIIMMRGWNSFDAVLKTLRARQARNIVFIGLLVWGFFSIFSWDTHLELKAAQRSLGAASEAVKEQFLNLENRVYYYNAYAFSQPMGLDIFDQRTSRKGWQLYTGEPIPDSAIIVFEPYFFPIETGIHLDRLMADERFELLGIFNGQTRMERTHNTHVFLKKPDTAAVWTMHVLPDSTAPVIDGRKTIKLNTENQYSKGLRSGLKSFPEGSKMVISFDAWCERPGNAMPGKMVLSASENYRTYEWRGQDLIVDTLPARTWHHYRWEQTLPKERLHFNEFILLVWNPEAEPLYISNLKITNTGL